MSRRRFYASPDCIDGSLVTLSAEETHHLAKVLRLKPGDEAFVFDGRGAEYRCAILDVDKSTTRLRIIVGLSNIVESTLYLTLAQALAKGDKFDFIVQKATELGVSRVIPIITDHLDFKLNAGQADKRVERWSRISLEALKQCGRRRLVDITKPTTIDKLFKEEKEIGLPLVFSEKGGAAVSEVLRDVTQTSAVTVFIGPEGGWSDAELTSLSKHGAAYVTLGPRILRTETASVVAVSLIQHLLGDLSSAWNKG